MLSTLYRLHSKAKYSTLNRNKLMLILLLCKHDPLHGADLRGRIATNPETGRGKKKERSTARDCKNTTNRALVQNFVTGTGGGPNQTDHLLNKGTHP